MASQACHRLPGGFTLPHCICHHARTGSSVRAAPARMYMVSRAVASLGFGVEGLGFGVEGLGFGVWGLGFGV